MNRFERAVLWGSTLLVTLSGIAYAILKYFVVGEDPFAIANHPWQPFFLKMHVLSAPALVFGVGVVFTKHVWTQWRSGTPAGRRTGATVLLLLMPMVITGYLIQTVTVRSLLWWVVAAHLVTGGGYIVAIAGHRIRASAHSRAARRRREGMSAVEPVQRRSATNRSW